MQYTCDIPKLMPVIILMHMTAHIPPYQLGLHFVKSTPSNDSLKEAV